MKRVLTAVLILALAVAMTACSTDEHKALEKTESISKKEAEAAVLEQVRAEEEREVELVSLTDIGGTWFSLICLKEGDEIIVEDGYLGEKEGAYTYHGFNKIAFYFGKGMRFFNADWSREIDGKTIYVSISKEMIVNERPHWNSGAHRVNDDVDIHYSVEWD